jgi:hypothetical protein
VCDFSEDGELSVEEVDHFVGYIVIFFELFKHTYNISKVQNKNHFWICTEGFLWIAITDLVVSDYEMINYLLEVVV